MSNPILKNTPMFDGTTSFGTGMTTPNCPEKMGDNFGMNSLRALESELSYLEKNPNSFGKKMKKLKKLKKLSKKLSKKISKKLKKKYSKKLKKKLKKLSRKFGTFDPTTSLGLPPGTSSSTLMKFQDPFIKGAPLPEPYGPIDNARMPLLYKVSGFGTGRAGRTGSSKRSKKMKKLKKLKKILKKRIKNLKRKSKKGHLRKFGTTPGTPDWTKSLTSDYLGIEYANPEFKTAKGYDTDPILGFKPGANTPWNSPTMQYSDNNQNITHFNFSKRMSKKLKNLKRKQKKVKKMMKKEKIKEKLSKKLSKKKFKNSFGGSFPSTSSIVGPNMVGYEPDISTYYAGATTIDYLTRGNLYKPIGIVGGPTNSTGSYASVGTFSDPVMKVQSDGMTPNAWLNTAAGLNASSSGFNTANTYLNKGLGFGKGKKKGKKNRFGLGNNMVYSPSSILNSVGLNTIAQPGPDYLNTEEPKFDGGISVGFGKKGNKKPAVRKRPRLSVHSARKKN